MAFEMKNFMVFKKVNLPKSQVEKECAVELEGDVSKILSASAQISLVSTNIGDSELGYTAEICSCVVYTTSDSKIGSSNSICEFAGKIQDDMIKNGDKAIISLTIKDWEVSYEDGTAVLKVLIQEEVELLTQKEIKSIDCNDDDVCTKKSTITIDKFIADGRSETETVEEIVARGSVKKIVSIEPSITIKSCDAENGSVTVSGNTIVRLVYLTDDDKFEVSYVNGMFKEEIEVEGCEQRMSTVCKPSLNLKNCIAEVLESDKGTKISIKTPFALNVYVFSIEDIETVEDMYSTTNEIAMASESFDMTKICKTEILESKIDGNLTLSEEKPRVDKIIFNGGNNISVTNAYVSNRELFIEGIAKTTVVYLNDDEGTLNSVEIEVPFALSDKTEASDDAIVTADAILFDTDISVKKGREFFFDGKVKVNARVCEEEISATITKADRGENHLDKDCAMQYVFGKAGEHSWDIAKRNKIKEEQLLYQNSDVTFPLIQDTGFVLFFQKLM